MLYFFHIHPFFNLAIIYCLFPTFALFLYLLIVGYFIFDHILLISPLFPSFSFLLNSFKRNLNPRMLLLFLWQLRVFYFVHYRSFSGHFSSSLTDLWHYFGDFSLPNSICSAKISYFCYKLWLVEQWIMLNRIIIVVIRISFSLNLRRSSSCKKKWRILSGFFPFASWQDI